MSSLQNGMLIPLVLWAAAAQSLLAIQAEQPEKPSQPASAGQYAPYPVPDAGYVSDHANILSSAEEEQIERWLWQVEKRTKVEIIVVLISSIKDYPGTANKNIESFAKGLFDTYKIGNMPKNDGILLLVAQKDRKARIELGAGYGRARDADAARIMQSTIVPRFAAGDYPGGVSEGVQAIMLEFANTRVGFNWRLFAILIALPVVGLVSFSLFKSGKRGWGWIFAGLFIVLIMSAVAIILAIIRALPDSESSSWSSGGSGGFGGGFSGGGGATGSW